MEYEIKLSSRFKQWYKRLTLSQIRTVDQRMLKMCKGNFGDHHQTDKDLWELRFMSGDAAELRIYYTIREGRIVFLAAGGNKSSQKKDIEAAKNILKLL